ncbi:hypothetical protein FSARC_11207 [Fusarium sarcochroum]|uniref:ASX DEUBAD domain-containing protein n=1 Tax=Fusarium sarcochroum TaxID=1208366 RepID=A0A8H4TH93_9HYPO|nr:hypothetical protein FSARC_11207 [Fusarium sarcochroum]
MADEEGETIMVSTDGARNAQCDVPPSSPLSSVPERELDDASIKVDQQSDTPATSLPGLETSPNTTPKKNKGKKRVVVRKAARRSKWNADNILTDLKSPLASADLRSILSNPMAWDILEKEEKADILTLFPDSQHILDPGTEDACPDFASLMNDDSFRYDCAAYTGNIAQGRHDPEWLAQAWAAHERRKIGDFDDYLDNKFKDEWDVELPLELKTNRGPAIPKEESDVKMEDTESVQDGNDTNTDTKMENGTKDQCEDLNHKNEVDELQGGSPAQKEQKVVTIGQQKGSEMEIDELA